MTTFDRPFDSPSQESDAIFESRLRNAYGAAIPIDRRIAIRAAVLSRPQTQRRSLLWSGRLALPTASMRVRLAIALAVVTVLVLGAGSLSIPSPTPVSAKQLLQRAASAVTPQAGQVVHETTAITVQGQDLPGTAAPRDSSRLSRAYVPKSRLLISSEGNVSTGSATPDAPTKVDMEQWTQVDGAGNPLQLDLTDTPTDGTFSNRTVGEADGDLWFVTENDQGTQASESSWTPGQQLFQAPPGDASFLFLGKRTTQTPQSPSAMANLLQKAANGTDSSIQLLPSQTIDGVSYDAVQIILPKIFIISNQSDDKGYPSGVISGTATVYVDPSSYLIRRIDSTAY